MLYIKLLVSLVVVGVAVRVDDVGDEDGIRVFGSGGTESGKDRLQSVENEIIQRTKHGAVALDVGAPTSGEITNSEFTTQVQKMLNDMKTKTQANNKLAQQSITTAHAAFGVCTKAFDARMTQKKTELVSFKAKQKKNSECHVAKEVMWTAMDTCKKKEVRLSFEHKECTADIQKHTDSRSGFCNSFPNDDETELDWLERMQSSFTAKLAAMRTKITACHAKGTELQNQIADCAAKTTIHTDKQRACDALGVQMDEQACQAASTSTTGCSEQGACYAAAVKSYNVVTADVKLQEADHKVEHRLWERVKCLLGALGTGAPGTADKAKLDACIAAKYSTDAVEIKYTATPAQGGCPAHPLTPCGDDYMNDVYTPLPTHNDGRCTICILPWTMY